MNPDLEFQLRLAERGYDVRRREEVDLKEAAVRLRNEIWDPHPSTERGMLLFNSGMLLFDGPIYVTSSTKYLSGNDSSDLPYLAVERSVNHLKQGPEVSVVFSSSGPGFSFSRSVPLSSPDISIPRVGKQYTVHPVEYGPDLGIGVNLGGMTQSFMRINRPSSLSRIFYMPPDSIPDERKMGFLPIARVAYWGLIAQYLGLSNEGMRLRGGGLQGMRYEWDGDDENTNIALSGFHTPDGNPVILAQFNEQKPVRDLELLLSSVPVDALLRLTRDEYEKGYGYRPRVGGLTDRLLAVPDIMVASGGAKAIRGIMGNTGIGHFKAIKIPIAKRGRIPMVSNLAVGFEKDQPAAVLAYLDRLLDRTPLPLLPTS